MNKKFTKKNSSRNILKSRAIVKNKARDYSEVK